MATTYRESPRQALESGSGRGNKGTRRGKEKSDGGRRKKGKCRWENGTKRVWKE